MCRAGTDTGGNTPFYIVDSSRVDNDGSASNIGFIPPIEEVKGISYVPYLSIDDFEGTYSEYEENKKRRLGNDEPKRFKYKKLMAE